MTNGETILSLGGARVVSVGKPEDAECVVVLLHGFQMTPHDLSPFAHSLNVPAWFVFPEAPLAATPGRSWFEIDVEARARALLTGPRDFAGIHPKNLDNARELLTRILHDVRAMAPGKPVILGGFSQGGMVSSDTMLRTLESVAGLVLLSSSRVALDSWKGALDSRTFAKLPVFVTHGETDDDLSYSAGEGLRDLWTSLGADVRFLSFPQGHLIPLVVWRHLRKFILSVMAVAS